MAASSVDRLTHSHYIAGCQIQGGHEMAMSRNPLRRWFEKQPASVTGAVIAAGVGVSPPYIFVLMDEDSVRYIGMETAFAIEDFTKGEVTARSMYEHARRNRVRAAKLKEMAA